MDPEIKEKGALHAGLGLGPKLWEEIALKSIGMFAVLTLFRAVQVTSIISSNPEIAEIFGDNLGVFDRLTRRLLHPYTYIELALLILVCFAAAKLYEMKGFVTAVIGLPLAINWPDVFVIFYDSKLLFSIFDHMTIGSFFTHYGYAILLSYMVFFLVSWVYLRPDKEKSDHE